MKFVSAAIILAGSLAAFGTIDCPSLPRRRQRQGKRIVDGGCLWVAKTQSRLGHWTANRPLSDRHDRPGRHGPHRRRLDDHARQVRREHPQGGRLPPQPQPPQRPDRRPRAATTATPTATASRCCSSRRCWAKRKTKSAARSSSTCSPRPCSSAARRRPHAGGWGYVSAKDGNNFDEGSTTITQVQGLRGCRNAGIVVPKEIIDKAMDYIQRLHDARRRRAVQLARAAAAARRSPPRPSPACSTPATTTASTCPRCWTTARPNLANVSNAGLRPLALHPLLLLAGACIAKGGKEWEPFRDKLYAHILKEANRRQSWNRQHRPDLHHRLNLIMLQLDKAYLPIYQR